MTLGSRPFIPAPNTASVELIYMNGSLVIENVLHVYKGSPYVLADLTAVRTIFDAWDLATWKAQRSEGWLLTRIKSKALDTAIAPVEDFPLPAPRIGAQSGQQFPPSATFAVKLSSGLTGRSSRGRLFVPGLTAAMSPQPCTFLYAANANGIVAALNTLKGNLAAGGHTLCITSYSHDKAWRATAVNYAVTGISYSDLSVDCQRRRLAGRGRS